jgi:hypothetical protein
MYIAIFNCFFEALSRKEKEKYKLSDSTPQAFSGSVLRGCLPVILSHYSVSFEA